MCSDGCREAFRRSYRRREQGPLALGQAVVVPAETKVVVAVAVMTLLARTVDGVAVVLVGSR